MESGGMRSEGEWPSLAVKLTTGMETNSHLMCSNAMPPPPPREQTNGTTRSTENGGERVTCAGVEMMKEMRGRGKMQRVEIDGKEGRRVKMGKKENEGICRGWRRKIKREGKLERDGSQAAANHKPE
ncbi:hypothetical protein C1H46_028717 [Malus baccata]|uniref:Uncharacterized protein n=1 Tax=Malus baccata TaxID=106549 RepID=A0A540LH53_MALBA|nr:hypothetical protein C1H46_028717 [Malus baccata]